MPRKSTDSRRQQIAEAIRQYLASMPREVLIERVFRLAEQEPELWEELRKECHSEPQADSSDELIRWAEDAIREATAPGLEYGGD
jgi:hypothetical protein